MWNELLQERLRVVRQGESDKRAMLYAMALAVVAMLVVSNAGYVGNTANNGLEVQCICTGN